MRLRYLLACLLGFAFATPGAAQNLQNGSAIYNLVCAGCHTPNPVTAPPPYNQILQAANNPAAITTAAQQHSEEMGFILTTYSQADLRDIAAYLATLVPATGPATTPVVEFYNAARDHYFISAAPDEIRDLDSGVHAGWARTGFTFKAYAGSGATASPVCRFYLPPENGDSHFFSASPAECDQVRAKFPTFVYEAPNVFYMGLPDTTTGVCPAGTTPVYRVWDSRVDSNHRYMTSTATRAGMIAAGWVAEGYGPDAVIMCSPL
jgi:cytochrome c553